MAIKIPNLNLNLVCHVDIKWKRRFGRKWKSQLSDIVNEASVLLSRLVEINIQFGSTTIEWRGLNRNELDWLWKNMRHNLIKSLSEVCRHKEREVFFLLMAKEILISRIANEGLDIRNSFHVGFVNVYKISGGGISGHAPLPIFIVHRAGKTNSVALFIHEFLHTLGARHSRRGIMKSTQPLNPYFLDKKNKELIRKKIIKHLSRY